MSTITSEEIKEPSLRGRRASVLRNVWGDIHEADELIPAGDEVLIRDLRGRLECGEDLYVVEYRQHFFRVARDNLQVVP